MNTLGKYLWEESKKEDCFGQMICRHHLAEFQSKDQFLFKILQYGRIHCAIWQIYLNVANISEFGKYILQFKEIHFATSTNTCWSNDS